MMPVSALRWSRWGLRTRLLLLAALVLALALAAAGWGIARLFERHVTQQFDLRLQDQMTQLLASLQADAQGRPVLTRALADPRWERPYSGLYWQVQPADEARAEPWLRSWSLWDARLDLPADTLADGALHRHTLVGPMGQPLRVLERTVRVGDPPLAWRVAVAAQETELRAALADFRGALVLSLGLLAALLMLALWAQVSVGLRPLRALQQAVRRVRQGAGTRLQGAFPAEVQPLVEDFNRVLDHADEVVERARRLAGNLAHGIKTPLAVMSALADDETLPRAQLVRQWREQLQMVQDQVDWHLRRARAAALAGRGQRTLVAPALEALLRVMRKVHAGDDRAPLVWTLQVAPDLAFAGELQDWQEMAGNLLDNAGRWARQRVVVTALRQGAQLVLRVEDDGPGLSAAQCAEVLCRGIRLDERAPGSGLGLDIVRELARLYGGDIELTRSALGGLCAELRVPAAPPPAASAPASR